MIRVLDCLDDLKINQWSFPLHDLVPYFGDKWSWMFIRCIIVARGHAKYIFIFVIYPMTLCTIKINFPRYWGVIDIHHNIAVHTLNGFCYEVHYTRIVDRVDRQKLTVFAIFFRIDRTLPQGDPRCELPVLTKISCVIIEKSSPISHKILIGHLLDLVIFWTDVNETFLKFGYGYQSKVVNH